MHDSGKSKLEREVEVGSLELQLHELRDEILNKASTFDHESEVIEAEIKELMPAIARTIKTEHGSAKWRKGSVRISYDTKALDACIDEYVKATILPYRKETQIAPGISIEVY
ncbi:MAG: hypothetical protein ABH833_00335 [Parcubacteria group bacterium]